MDGETAATVDMPVTIPLSLALVFVTFLILAVSSDVNDKYYCESVICRLWSGVGVQNLCSGGCK